MDRRHLSTESRRHMSAYKSVRSVKTLKQSISTYRAYTKSLAVTKRSDSLYNRTKKYQSSLTSSKRARPLTRTDLKLLENKDQPVKGMTIYVIYTLLKSICFVCASYLYRRNPDLNPFQMLVMRSIFALLCQVIYLNRNLKKAVWDGINRKNSGPLIVRSA